MSMNFVNICLNSDIGVLSLATAEIQLFNTSKNLLEMPDVGIVHFIVGFPLIYKIRPML